MLSSAEPATLKPTEHIDHIVNAQTSACSAYFSNMTEPKGAIISLLKSSGARFLSNGLQH